MFAFYEISPARSNNEEFMDIYRIKIGRIISSISPGVLHNFVPAERAKALTFRPT